MATEPTNPAGREQVLDEILTAYLKAVDAGQPPDRRELLARYPELAPDLERFLADQDAIGCWTEPLRGREPDTPLDGAGGWPDPPLGSFGDYELLGVLGQGGMGTVYKAQQRSLNRLVALKVIRAGEPASPADVRRFRTEAEVVAGLEHPNIVPVYEVGERDGLLFLSMRLVEGGTLAEQLKRFAAEPRTVARMVADVAQAVHFTHQHGVLHRDLKPGNVLLDADGRPLVTDFGLAKWVESDSSLTQSGEIVGTPSYMAPEQTSGRKGAVTTATDVYGLGAVLYALLTGRSPFRGESVLETLEQVKTCEPELPHRSNPRVDRDLETICLKCLQKAPHRRFESAQALAEDLERWLTGEPIWARPTPAWERGLKWAKRRPAQALLLVVWALVGAAALVWTYREREHSGQLQSALEAKEQQRTQAVQNLERAIQMANLVVDRDVAQELQLVKPAHMPGEQAGRDGWGMTLGATQEGAFRSDLAESLLAFYRGLIEEGNTDAEVRRREVMYLVRMGNLHRRLGRDRDAAEAFLQAQERLKDVQGELPGDFADLDDLGTALNNLANGHLLGGRLAEAARGFERARIIYARLSAAAPADPKHDSDLAAVTSNLGALAVREKRHAEAGGLYRKALAIRDRLAQEHPDFAPFQNALAVAHLNLGLWAESVGQLGPARDSYRRAGEVGEALVQKRPGVSEYRNILGRSFFHLADLEAQQGRGPDARAAFQKALAVQEPLAREYPGIRDYVLAVAKTSYHLGAFLHSHKQHDQALAWYGRAVPNLEAILKSEPGHAEARTMLLRAYVLRADILTRSGEFAKAMQDWDRATPMDDGHLSLTLWFGQPYALVGLGRHALAVKEAARLVARAPGNGEVLCEAVGVYSLAAAKAAADAQLSVNERRNLAERHAAEAVGLLERARKAGVFRQPRYRNWIEADTDLDVLRTREDFQTILRRVVERTGKP